MFLSTTSHANVLNSKITITVTPTIKFKQRKNVALCQRATLINKPPGTCILLMMLNLAMMTQMELHSFI